MVKPNGYLAKHQTFCKSLRSANREMITLRNALDWAGEDGLIKNLPMENLSC